MRYTNYILPCLLGMAIQSCSNEDFFDNKREENTHVFFQIDKFVDESNTRTSYNPATYAVTWASGDVIGIFPYEGDQEPFAIPSSQVGQVNASFDGGYWALKDGKTYNAYYPFDRKNYESSDMKTQIPVTYLGQSQNGLTPNIGRYDYTYSDWKTSSAGQSVNFSFHHIGSILQLTLPLPTTANYTSLVLSVDSDVIPTKGTYNLKATSPAFIPDATSYSSSIELKLENIYGESSLKPTFYMMMPVVDLTSKNITATLYTEDGSFCSYSVPSRNFTKGSLRILTGTPISSNIEGTSYEWYAENGYVDDNSTFNVTTTNDKRLSSLLSSSVRPQIKYLKIAGPLNSNDISLLRSLSALEVLDLTDASIIESSAYYYAGGDKEPYWEDETFGAQSTKADVFPALFMFKSSLTNLHTLYMPNSVKEIPYYCLWGGQSLKNIKLGSGLTKINYLSFDCGIQSITIPKNVGEDCVYLGVAFEKCHDLVSVNVEEGNSKYYSFDGVLYSKESSPKWDDTEKKYKDAYILERWPAAKEFNGFPEDLFLWTVGFRSFGDCKLTEVVFPEGVNTMHNTIFVRCKNLKSVTIPASASHNVNTSEWFSETNGGIYVHMKSQTPPNWYFLNSDKISRIIVPSGCSSNYRNDTNWRSLSIYEEGWNY